MKLELQKFGKILVSRPAGKEAYLVACAYNLPKNKDELIEVDFTGVEVLTPSWADEFLTPMAHFFGKRLIILFSKNPSVVFTLETLEKANDFIFEKK